MFLIGYSSKKEVLAEETQMEIPLSLAEFFFSASQSLSPFVSPSFNSFSGGGLSHFFVDPPGLPDTPSSFGLSGQASRPGFLNCTLLMKKRHKMRRFSVDPPGLEPGLCGTKIRRVANYTMGQSAPDKAWQK